MAEIKWIKITTDIFDDEKILLIESMPEADSVIVIWFKLLCLAGKQNNNGIFMLNDRLAYTDEMLAAIFRRPLNVIRLALQTFEQFGMIEIINNVITIPNWEKHQNAAGLDKIREQTRQRVAKHRDKQRLLLGGDICSYCGNPATGFDHIIPLARGGKDTEENTTPCCIDCNRKKNDKPLIDFLNNYQDIIDNDVVMSNLKLTKYVTRSNVTGRYMVTQCNAIEEDKDKDIDKDTDKEKESDIKADKPQRTHFVPPTVEQVKAYCRERNNNVDAERFVDYYTANGWTVGRNKMKDWKAAVRTWEKNGFNTSVKRGVNGVQLAEQKTNDLDDIF